MATHDFRSAPSKWRSAAPSARLVRAAAVWSCIAAIVVGCSGSDGSSACGNARRQQAQPDSSRHLIAGAPDPSYVTDPPTSGPHVPMPDDTFVYDEALPKVAQVGILEWGGVLVQYRPGDIDAEGRAALEALAGDGIVVAPAPELAEPVIASAWVHLLSCDAVDTDALRSFAEEFRNKSPGAH